MTQRTLALLTGLALVVASCTSDADSGGDTTTTAAPTTTTTTVPTASADDVCNSLKVAVFDLESNLGEVFSAESLADPESIDQEQVGRDFIGAIVEFYDTIDAMAETAPTDIRDDFATISDSVEGLREQLDSLENLDGALENLDPGALDDPAVADSAQRIEAWTTLNCDTAIAVDVETVLLDNVLGAVFGAFGDSLGGLGDLGNLGDLGDLGGLGGLGDGFGDAFDAVTFGDDPALDQLWSECESGVWGSCDELYFSSFNVYELFAVTCGGTVDFYSFTTRCADKYGSDSLAYGDDALLDGLYDDCGDGDALSCDQLFGASPIGSSYEAFALTCGDTRPASGRPCEFDDSGDPFTYGEDPDLDADWDACSLGDPAACDDLYFESPFGSAYESFGDDCGKLIAREENCSAIADLLDGPVG